MVDATSPNWGREPEVVVLEDRGGDERGASFSLSQSYLEFLGAPKDMHIASILPGHIRGNHYHAARREIIVVIHGDRWSLHWDRGANTEVSTRAFTGEGVVAIAVPQNSAHAIRNDGEKPLWLVAATDGIYDPDAPDAYRRIVSQP
jgi:oxalate decarboxylase/phosphoglucose isomerase-like protein (cupin superfamily)